MKKFLAMLLVMVMIFSLGVFATETTTETEQVETSEEIIEEVETIGTETTTEEKEQIYFKSKVIEASEVGEKTYKMEYYGQEMEYPVTGQDLKLIVQEGKYKGVEINLVFPLGEQGATEYDDPAKVGQTIYLYVTQQTNVDGTISYNGEIVLPINSTREIIVVVATIALLILIVLLSRLSSIKTIGIVLLNTIILFVAFGVLYLKAIPALVTLAITSILIIVTNTIIINNLSKKTLVAILGIILATIITASLCICFINLTDVSESFKVGTYTEGEKAKPEYIDIIIGTVVIASIGVAINMAVKTVNEYIKGEGTIQTIKTISAELVKCLNGVLLLITSTILINVFSIALQNYPLHMIFFGDDNTFLELIKVLIIVINPVIVIPITAVLGKILLAPTKRIDEAK